MKAAKLLAVLALCGCSDSGGGGGDNHGVMVSVRGGIIDEPMSVWYKACERAQTDPYGKEWINFVPEWEPWIPIGELKGREEIFVGELAEGYYSFVWCAKGEQSAECPGCQLLCPEGWQTTWCRPVLKNSVNWTSWDGKLVLLFDQPTAP